VIFVGDHGQHFGSLLEISLRLFSLLTSTQKLLKSDIKVFER